MMLKSNCLSLKVGALHRENRKNPTDNLVSQVQEEDDFFQNDPENNSSQ
jgi:hypothetical protein